MPSQFESFINVEIPKRISTDANPLTVPAGKVFVSTGVGLQTTPVTYSPGGALPWQLDRFDLSTTVSFPHSFTLTGAVVTNSETATIGGLVLDRNDGNPLSANDYTISGTVITLSTDYNSFTTGKLRIKYQT